MPSSDLGGSAVSVLEAWRAWAHRVRSWLRQQGASEPEAVVLVTLPTHAALARSAWAALGDGWMPRIGTCRMLVREHGGLPVAGLAAPGQDPAQDLLRAQQMLLQQPWGAAWQRRDRRGFSLGVQMLLEAARTWATQAAACPAPLRLAWAERAEHVLTTAPGVLVRERMLAVLGLQWAMQSAYETDALWSLPASAWVVLEPLATDELSSALGRHAQGLGKPVLWADIVSAPAPRLLQRAVCADFEDEAQRAAAQVLAWLAAVSQPSVSIAAPTAPTDQDQPAYPVALYAQDRELVRRVRALLERAGVRVVDETGWRLSTTRAAAALMAWMRAARTSATAEHLLDALTSGWARSDVLLSATVRELEALLAHSRGRSLWGHVLPLQPTSVTSGAGAELMARLVDWTRPLRWDGSLSLAAALERLRLLLQQLGVWEALQADDAGRQMLDALRLAETAGSPQTSWDDLAARAMLDAEAFLAWVDGVLDAVSFVPPASGEADVVITPSSRAWLRPFAAAVWAGCDDQHLSAPQQPMAWLGARVLGELGLPTALQLAARALRQLDLALSGQPVYLSWRTADAGRPLAASAFLQRWSLAAMGREPDELPPAADARTVWQDAPQPQLAPQPRLLTPTPDGGRVQTLLPSRISATAYEALRACPYRFHTRVLLGLREPDEPDDPLDKRDYGNWLHEVLRRFHLAEASAVGLDADGQRRLLLQCAEQLRREQGWDDLGGADFLPFAAAFERLAPEYLAWWNRQRVQGAAISRLEAEFESEPLALYGDAGPPVRMYGRIDRLDLVPDASSEQRQPGASRVAWRILDYKTSSQSALKSRMKPLTEDTQMAFYAALLQSCGVPERLQASYLALEDRQVAEVPHEDVEASAAWLREGLQQDLQRIAGGAPMPALGEGTICDYCEARGLCRRDHWTGGPS